MAGSVSCRFCTQAVLIGMLVFGLGVGQVGAGQEEDFAAGMVSYRRADFSTAIPLLRKVADAGHAEAQAVLASILDAADSDEEAVAYYRKSAAAGNLEGIFGLGGMLANGEGVTKDVKEARALYQRAAEAGHKQAIGAMAQAYIRGELDIPEDQRKGKEALSWISRAADDGFILAIETMEKAYRTGEFGLPVDVQKADLMKKKLMTISGAKEKKGRRRGDAK